MIRTAQQMYIAFLHGIQKEDAEGVPPDKFKYWINKAQEEWMSERAKEFDQDQKRIDDLHTLRTERVIPINGSRAVTAAGTLKLDSSGDGTFVVTEETYFKITSMSFQTADASTGTINEVTGVVSDAVIGDVFYCLVTYAELVQNEGEFDTGVATTDEYNDEIAIEITIADTLAKTHTGSQITNDAGTYATYNALVGCDVADSTRADGYPFIAFTDYKFLIPNDYPNPRYFRLLNVLFRITYIDNSLHDNDDVSAWQRADIMRADERADIMQNAYRYPSDEKMYYRFAEEHLELINETDSTPLKCKLEYLRYPNEIVYYEPSSGNTDVDCELAPVQQKEITDMAVMMYIEATANPRYQTQVVEDQRKNTFE